MKKTLLFAMFLPAFVFSQNSAKADTELIWDRLVKNILAHEVAATAAHVDFPLSTYLGTIANEEAFAAVFDELFTTVFVAAMRKMGPGDITLSSDGENELTYSLAINHVEMVDDFEVESMLFLQFKKRRDDFKLTLVMMAG
jgi:hypothetical protein